jgi:GNAT superfamily N-acetyltransferase
MASIRVESTYGATKRRILGELIRFNVAAVGGMTHQPLAITAQDRGEVVGGLIGETYLGWLAIELLWVSDRHRHKGLGKTLMATAETEARKRGARSVYLNTFDFQAPEFYQKLGYREFGRLDDFPVGHTRYWMTKAL